MKWKERGRLKRSFVGPKGSNGANMPNGLKQSTKFNRVLEHDKTNKKKSKEREFCNYNDC